MKNLKKFETHLSEKIIKGFDQNFPLDELLIGQDVLYRGIPFEVAEKSKYIAVLKSKETPYREIKVNQNMFNKNGYINK